MGHRTSKTDHLKPEAVSYIVCTETVGNRTCTLDLVKNRMHTETGPVSNVKSGVECKRLSRT